jgi:predicted CDP-diglyceride synthetase/phosphatidate cytidylyltransferase
MDKSKILKIVLVAVILATLVYMVQKWKQTVNEVQDTQQEIREKE